MAQKGFQPVSAGFSTAAIHAGQSPAQWASAAVVPPIVTATTFKQVAPGETSGYTYSRSENPTRSSLEACLAAIEGSKYAVTFASGMGAITTIVGLLNAGDHLIASDDLYGGTTRYFKNVVAKMGIEISYIDFTDLESVKLTIKPNTKMVWLESPTNPLLKVVDISAVSAIAKTVPGVIVVTDNTFLTPYLQRPLDLGADISMYSLTKYMNGHSDVVMGSAATNDTELYSQLRFMQNSLGVIPSPFDCYLVNRSLKTLALRMDKHRENSYKVALFLSKHPHIDEVMHPELPSHPQHSVAQKQCSGHSGVFSFRHAGGMEHTTRLVKALKVISLAESLGGYESLVALPFIMSHGSLSEELRNQLGITSSVIRISVGLEDANDLIEDLEQALHIAFQVPNGTHTEDNNNVINEINKLKL